MEAGLFYPVGGRSGRMSAESGIPSSKEERPRGVVSWGGTLSDLRLKDYILAARGRAVSDQCKGGR